MKKKLFLVVAVVLIVAATCALLVGCAPSNPTEFFEKWLDSNSKSMTIGGTEQAMDGNISCTKSAYKGNEMNVYSEITGDKVISYMGTKTGDKFAWIKKTMTKEEFKNLTGEDADLKKGFNEQANLIVADYFEDFDEKFTKKDGAYVGKEDTPYQGVSIKISGKQMTIIRGEGNDKLEVILKLGHGKISIPKEAKDAPEGEIPFFWL